MRVLLTGWFSFEQMGATAGDMLCRELLANWLRDASIPFDMAVAAPFFDGVDWRHVDPSDYTDVIFICGPFGNGPPLSEFLSRFRHSRLAGINLSMLQILDEWNPFDLLIERDSSRTTRPDLSFLSPYSNVPVIGLILAHHQQEYGDRRNTERSTRRSCSFSRNRPSLLSRSTRDWIKTVAAFVTRHRSSLSSPEWTQLLRPACMEWYYPLSMAYPPSASIRLRMVKKYENRSKPWTGRS